MTTPAAAHCNHRVHWLLLALLIALSLPVKLLAAHNTPWEIDIVPVLSRTLEYGAIAPVGTLSSVAAYNLPMLEWLHMPALLLTRDATLSLVLTLLFFNVASTLAVYRLAESLFRPLAGLIAAALFAFSEVGISSAYTAWAQLLLPGFYALTALCLWEWRKQENGLFLALAGMMATAAFMTHFSAVLLYPAMLAFALLSGARWQWRGLLLGVVGVALMLAPYVLFEIERDFVDVKAFLSQEMLVSDEVLEQVQVLKPEAGPLPETLPEFETRPKPNPQQGEGAMEAPSRLERILAYALRSPENYLRALTVYFRPAYPGLGALHEKGQLSAAALALLQSAGRLPLVLFFLSLGLAAVQFGRALGAGRPFRRTLAATGYGRVLLLWAFLTVVALGFIGTRSIRNDAYLMGFISLQIVIASYGAVQLIAWAWGKRALRWLPAVLLLALSLSLAGNVADRLARLALHDDAAFSPYNVSLLRHVRAATDFIAQDWAQDWAQDGQGEEVLTVSYDILPEMRNLWWVPAWHSIDPHYRMGMNFDVLLELHHGLRNTNTDPIGRVPDADYIVVYTPGLARYDLTQYEQQRFGAIVVLKPIE